MEIRWKIAKRREEKVIETRRIRDTGPLFNHLYGARTSVPYKLIAIPHLLNKWWAKKKVIKNFWKMGEPYLSITGQ